MQPAPWGAVAAVAPYLQRAGAATSPPVIANAVKQSVATRAKYWIAAPLVRARNDNAAPVKPAVARTPPMVLVRILVAILLPPLAVFLQVGFTGHFWLNILLTLLGYLPGLVHAIWIIARRS